MWFNNVSGCIREKENEKDGLLTLITHFMQFNRTEMVYGRSDLKLYESEK